MPRGGRRPGAGAPKHNFNALKNGMYSDRMRRIGVMLLDHPLFRLLYKRIRANLVKQILSTRPQKPAPRGFIGVSVDGKCRCLYLAPKNKKNQSNFVFFIYTKKWGQEKTIKQFTKTDTRCCSVGLNPPDPLYVKGALRCNRSRGFCPRPICPTRPARQTQRTQFVVK